MYLNISGSVVMVLGLGLVLCSLQYAAAPIMVLLAERELRHYLEVASAPDTRLTAAA